MTTVYLVALNEPRDDVWEILREGWKEHHLIVSPTLALFQDDSPKLVQEVAASLGLSVREDSALGDNPALGIVVDLGEADYGGCSYKQTWEWLRKAQRR